MAKKTRKKIGAFETPALRNASKTLLANIRFASLDEPVKTIAVTSAIMDEGKSTVVSNLACAMASSGLKVLVVDLDMRRRSLGSMLDAHNQYGVYSVLAGQASLNQAISRTQIPNLYFLDCESNVPNPPDILSTKRFAALVQALKSNFDYVVFDTPPVGLFPDAAIVAMQVDGVVMALRHRYTKRKDAVEAMKQLRAAEANILGTVLTFAPEEETDYYYYAYYNAEGKRVDKAKNQGDLTVTPKDFVQDDISSWAQNVGVSADAVRSQAVQDANPYAPGAYKRSASARHSR